MAAGRELEQFLKYTRTFSPFQRCLLSRETNEPQPYPQGSDQGLTHRGKWENPVWSHQLSQLLLKRRKIHRKPIAITFLGNKLSEITRFRILHPHSHQHLITISLRPIYISSFTILALKEKKGKRSRKKKDGGRDNISGYIVKAKIQIWWYKTHKKNRHEPSTVA